MRIIKIQAENVKKLKAVTIVPDANGVTLSGPNESGKTSTLDAIELALQAKSVAKDNPEPIRRGEDHAFSLVGLGEPVYDDDGEEIECKPTLTVRRRWTSNKTSYLSVENAEGAVYKSPQAILDALIGDLTFDPLAFSNLKEKEQLETLLKLVKISIDLDQWAVDRKLAYDERTAVNRKWAELDGQIKGIVVPDDTPDEEIPAAQVLREQQEAQAVIDANKQKRADVEVSQSRLNTIVGQIVSTDLRIADLEEELLDARQHLEVLKNDRNIQAEICQHIASECKALIDPDMSAFSQRIAEVEQVNRDVRLKKQRGELQARQEEARLTAEMLTREIAERDKERADALAAAQMPIEYLAFDDNGVTYKGIPFKQCSSEERLRVSVAMGMSLNPKLRVMFIRDGSLLDTKHREVIQQMARDNQYQLWLEVADDTGKVGLYFEDGEIVAGQENVTTSKRKKTKTINENQQGLEL